MMEPDTAVEEDDDEMTEITLSTAEVTPASPKYGHPVVAFTSGGADGGFGGGIGGFGADASHGGPSPRAPYASLACPLDGPTPHTFDRALGPHHAAAAAAPPTATPPALPPVASKRSEKEVRS